MTRSPYEAGQLSPRFFEPERKPDVRPIEAVRVKVVRPAEAHQERVINLPRNLASSEVPSEVGKNGS